MTPALGRAALAARGEDLPAAPVRIVHIGLGAFHRAHQAWYTAHAADAAEWGIAAYTGRHATVAEELTPQDGVFTLIERSANGDRFERIGSIVRTVPGDDIGDLAAMLADPAVAVLTLTITEPGYRVDAAGGPDFADPVVASDAAVLRARFAGEPGTGQPRTPLARVVWALEARRQAAAPPIAIVSCDNVPDNGRLLERALRGWADAVSPVLRDWLATGVTFVSTSVDRITPRTEPEDVAEVAERTGWRDASPVVAEPFADWVLSGTFPSGRPAWETAGARFVDDITPWELRKLWLLNGAHTLLACRGLQRGYRTVSDAIGDPDLRLEVERWWDEACRQLPDLDLGAYREALAERFANPRIEHRLAQIAENSLTKIRFRIVPVARRERSEGRPATAAARVLAAWLIAMREGVMPVPDEVAAAVGQPAEAAAAALTHAVDAGLGADPEFVHAVSASQLPEGMP